jgi:hypothetical protein
MEGDIMEYETPISQRKKWKMGRLRVLLVRVGRQSEVYLKKSIIPSQEKTKNGYTRQIIKWKSK